MKTKYPKKDKNVSVRIPIPLFEQYRQARGKAKKLGIKLNMSDTIRTGVEEYIEKIRNAEFVM